MTAKEFILGLPQRLSADAIGDKETVFHFDISGEEGGQYTFMLRDGQAQAMAGLHGEPKCVVRAKDTTLMKIVSGEENAAMAFMMGKVKVSNTGEMMQYAKMLGLMK